MPCFHGRPHAGVGCGRAGKDVGPASVRAGSVRRDRPWMATVRATPKLTDAGDRWIVQLRGAKITACCFAFEVELHLTLEDRLWTLQLAQPFVVVAPSGLEDVVVPEGEPARLAPALRLVHQFVTDVFASKDGALELRCRDGTRLQVPAGEAFEAWTMTGPDGVRLVSLPGGQLAIWGSTPDPP